MKRKTHLLFVVALPRTDFNTDFRKSEPFKSPTLARRIRNSVLPPYGYNLPRDDSLMGSAALPVTSILCTKDIESTPPPPPVEMISFFRETEHDVFHETCTGGSAFIGNDFQNHSLPAIGLVTTESSLCSDLFEMDGLEPRTIEEMVREHFCIWKKAVFSFFVKYFPFKLYDIISFN